MTTERTFVVYKYELAASDNFIAGLAGPIVRVGSDGRGVPCVWILGDKQSEARRHVIVVGTGQDLPAGDWVHRGSWVTDPFVWHCFEDNERPTTNG